MRTISESGWRELLNQQMEEAVEVLGSVPGVVGLIVGGSVGRGQPWPLSDIDVLPLYADRQDKEAGASVERRRSALVECWGNAGIYRSLDCGWLAFWTEEVAEAVSREPAEAAALMKDRRWFFGLDKAWSGIPQADPTGLAAALLRWIQSARFDPLVVDARVRRWTAEAREARQRAAELLAAGDHAACRAEIRLAANALMEALTERNGERSGSYSRAMTAFERMAARHGLGREAATLLELSGSRVEDTSTRLAEIPAWLRRRIERARAARQLVGEEVSEAENARDQIVAFSTWF
ncbi:MAG: nucleotidyltransferase domain-containing protein, partial [Candidatus Dormibacteraeota bacterium]|nr:nucleotidyltransferase domain-containing protein [Candidatus Dormibacteraeota bacterium]